MKFVPLELKGRRNKALSLTGRVKSIAPHWHANSSHQHGTVRPTTSYRLVRHLTNHIQSRWTWESNRHK